jgi:hypothetical protein
MTNILEAAAFGISAENIRGTSRFSAAEVRSILAVTGQPDVRQLGCPDHIFEDILHKNAEKRGIKPTPVQSPVDETRDIRIAQTGLF